MSLPELDRRGGRGGIDGIRSKADLERWIRLHILQRLRIGRNQIEDKAINLSKLADDITSGGVTTGPAGGVLNGTYPNPGFAQDMATQAELNAATADLVADDDPRLTDDRNPNPHTHPQSDITDLEDDLADKAPLNSPVFTGSPTAPTPAANDNDTSIATTAYVQTELNGVHVADGLPPASSPTPTVQGGIGQLFVKWSGITNNDPVTYEVHVAGSSGFTPDADTLYAETAATQATVKTLPPDDDPLQYDTTYYVKIMAKDADGGGYADPPPDASAEATGELVGVSTGDLAADFVIANELLAGNITGDKLAAVIALLSKIQTSDAGQRVEIDNLGIRLIGSDNEDLVVLPTDDGQAATFRGDAEFNTADFVGPATLRSASNEIQVGGELNLQGALGNPSQAPTVAVTWDQKVLSSGTGGSGTGIVYAADGGTAGGTPSYYLGRGASQSWRVDEINASTGAVSRIAFTRHTGLSSTVLGVSQGTDSGTRKLYALARWYASTPQTGLFAIRQSDGVELDFSIIGSAFVDDILPEHSSPATLGRGLLSPLLVHHDTNASGNLRIRPVNPTNAEVGTGITTSGLSVDYSPFTRLTGVVVDGSGNYWISVNSFGVGIAYKFNSSGVYQANNDFLLGDATATGLTHDGTNFISAQTGASPRVYTHTDWTWTTESAKYWAAYSWTDGSNETQVSPRQSIDLALSSTAHYRRAKLRITPASRPSGITATHYYANRGASDPGGTGSSGVQRQTTTSYIDSETNASALMKDFLANGTDGPASNGFAVSGSPAKIGPSEGTGYLATSGPSLAGNGEFRLPVVTTTQRGNLPANTGSGVFNSTTGQLEVYNGSAWGPSFGSSHGFPTLTNPTAAAPTVDRFYYVRIVLPGAATLSGIQYFVVTSAGNVRVALYNSAGTRVANRSTNLAVGTAFTMQTVGFDSSYAAAPGFYYIGIVFSSASAQTYFAVPAMPSTWVAGPGSGATAASVSPAGTVNGAAIPTMSTYG